MRAKGVVYVPTAATERVAAVILSFPHEDFTLCEILSRVSDLSYDTVAKVITAKARQGWLERTGRGRYRIGGIRIRTILPAGLLAEAAWAVLSTDPDRRFMRRGEITGEVETYLGRPGYSAYGPLSCILWVWHRDGHLERAGEFGEYAWRLREGVTQRPIYNHKTS